MSDKELIKKVKDKNVKRKGFYIDIQMKMEDCETLLNCQNISSDIKADYLEFVKDIKFEISKDGEYIETISMDKNDTLSKNWGK